MTKAYQIWEILPRGPVRMGTCRRGEPTLAGAIELVQMFRRITREHGGTVYPFYIAAYRRPAHRGGSPQRDGRRP